MRCCRCSYFVLIVRLLPLWSARFLLRSGWAETARTAAATASPREQTPSFNCSVKDDKRTHTQPLVKVFDASLKTRYMLLSNHKSVCLCLSLISSLVSHRFSITDVERRNATACVISILDLRQVSRKQNKMIPEVVRLSLQNKQSIILQKKKSFYMKR